MATRPATTRIVTSVKNARPPVLQSCILGVLTLLLLCLGNHALPLIDRDEPRFAEASREMLQNGDWILPRFNALPRYDKPPLIYWMQIACYRALGENAFAARLPSAVCMASCAALICLWAAALAADRENAVRIGVQAGIMFALCVQVFVHGRAAVADAPMVLCFLTAAWAGWNWINQNSFRNGFLFWTALGLGFLSKGPVAWIPIGMVLLAIRYNPKEHVLPRPLHWLCGIAWMLLLIGAWGIPALIQTRGEFASVGLGKHVVERSLVSMEGHGARHITGYLLSLPLYFVTLFISFAPWAWWLPFALRDQKGEHTRVDRYLLSGVWITFAVFTLSRTKLPHYTLPAFPILAIYLARWWETARSENLWRKVAVCTLAIFVLTPLCFRHAADLSVTENLLRELRPHLKSETPVCLVDYEEPSLIWGLRSNISGFPTKVATSEVQEWFSKNPQGVCILSDASAQKIEHARTLVSAGGWNFAKGKYLLLRALVHPSNPVESADGKQD